MGLDRSFLTAWGSGGFRGDHMVFLSMQGGSAVTDKH